MATSHISQTSIVLVDDNQVFRERLAKALERRGYRVQVAGNVPEARELLGRYGTVFHAAVVDLKMPGESGLELVRWLAEHHPATRVLVLTGYGSIATAVEAIRLGAADYLTKPADADQILKALFQPQDEAAPGIDSVEADVQFPSLERVEWEHLQRVLRECEGNVSNAARALGMHRRTLQRKLQKYPPHT